LKAELPEPMQTLSLGFSPCPNDTFMFDALVNKKIATSDLSFAAQLHDVQQLNLLAREGLLDVTKISMANYPAISKNYCILDAGSALGNGCGPLLISKEEISLQEVKNKTIAIPGKYTTANLLLTIFFPDARKKEEIIFSGIEDAVISGKTEAGLIIHENRFTYAEKGLKKIADMGELWEKTTGSPIPLGCIVVKRSIAQDVQQQINELIRKSIETAFDNLESTLPYVRKHAAEMDEKVMKQHIALYVNNFSLALGSEGKRAIALLFKQGAAAGLLPEMKNSIFVE
jgi:1,4-dihydroxy-6-naphthoate synthase